ncbi:MAG: response regulator [Chloroflexi bacterium]|nr:MAG: response regulator [Chloroflexota bacterium]
MIGRKLRDRYEIIEHLGDGSTATVYKAIDTRLGRDVALKVLLPHVRPNTRERFFQEANAAAQLNHPNIMSIYDVDEDDGQHFLVVEYVEGTSLADFVPSSPEVVVELGIQIALALQYAHELEIIHRDIKPANIKVTPEGQIKIMDLGLALPKEAKRVTTAGMVIGTPAYISPEQAQGKPLDNRTDIYSLGIVLYELVTGVLPFDSDDIGTLLLQQVQQQPQPPHVHVPDIPLGLENVILKAMEKNPVSRYQSCKALASALQASITIPGKADDTPPALVTGTQQSRRVITDQPTLRLILADDHTILRRTLINMLEKHQEFVVVAEASNGDEALEQTLSLLPDVLLLDLNMPGKTGLEVLPTVRSKAPNVKVLVLTGQAEDWYIVQALRAGAHGYLLKSADETELVEGITNVVEGHLVLGHGVAEKIVTGVLTGKSDGDVKLTEDERRVLLQVAGGYETEAIAAHLQMPMPTVIEMLAQSMNKLGAGDRHSAALIALRRNLISLDDLHNL